MRGADNNTATTAARIFSRLDSVEEVQRSRSGSAVGIAAQPGGAGGGAGAGAGAGAAVAVAATSTSAAAAAAAAVAAGSPARAGQQQQQKATQYGSVGVGVGGAGIGLGVGVGVGVGNAAGVVRNRSASTILDLGHSKAATAGQSALSRKFSSAATGTAGDVNGYGDGAAKCDTYNGLATAGAGAGAGGVGLGAGRIAAGAPVATASSLGISLRERLSISGASGGAAAAAEATTTVSGGSAPTIGSSIGPSVPHCKRQGSFSNVFSKLIDGMPASTMFAKFKSSANVAASTSSQNVAEGNPITQYFEIGKPVACAGPELCWRIHDGYRKSDNKVREPLSPSEMHTSFHFRSVCLSPPALSFYSPLGMLCVYIREEGSRETAQASPQGDHYRAAEGLGKDIGTLSSSPGECVLHKHLSTSKRAGENSCFC